MPLDPSIYAQFLRAPKSMDDYDRDAIDLDNARMGQKRNAMELMLDQQKVGQYQRGMQRQNALEQVYRSVTDPAKLPEALSGAGYHGEAAKFQSDLLDRDKKRTDIAKDAATTAKTYGEAQADALKRYRGALDFIDTPQGVARWLQAQYADPLLAQHMQALGPLDQALQRLPQDPAGLQQWRQQAAMGMEKYMEQQRLQAGQAETAQHNVATEALTRRGQDMTDARARETAAATLSKPFEVTGPDGLPAALHLLYTYESGTTTPKATHTDQAGAVPNENPIELDADGRCTMFLGSGAYTLALHDPDDAPVDGAQWDDVTGVPAASDDLFVPIEGGVTMTGLLTLSGNATANLNPVPLQQANSLIAASAATLTTNLGGQIPVGTIAMWLTGTPPTGWLELGGIDADRGDNPLLFALWGTAFGVGDGSTTFGIPNMRGEFPRGWDNGRSVDTARAIGSAQVEMIGPHTHPYLASSNGRSGGAEGGGRDAAGFGESYTTSNNTGTENRPRNIAFMFIVKAG